MITAVGTLLAALVALASFLVSQQFFTDPPSTSERPGGQGALVTDSAGKKLDGKVRWEGPLFLAYIDFDAEGGPDRRPDDADLDLYFYDSLGSMMGKVALARWTSEGAPDQNQCASALATHGVSGSMSYKKGETFCFMTDMSRVGKFQIVDHNDEGWEAQVTVWEQRLTKK